MQRPWRVHIVLLGALLSGTCGGGSSSPTTPTPTTPTVTAVAVTGPMAPANPGQSAQFTATATLSNGTTSERHHPSDVAVVE